MSSSYHAARARRLGRNKPESKRHARQLGLESLEDRTLLSVSPGMFPPNAFGPIEPVRDGACFQSDTFLSSSETPGEAPGLRANDADVDGDVLSTTLIDGPHNGTVVLNEDGSFEYTPNADFHGIDTFTYVAGDGQLQSEPATVSITVESVNDAPIAADDAYSTNEDEPLVVDTNAGLLANDADVDGDVLSSTLIDGPQNGTVVLNEDGSFEYTPNADFHGSDTFTYAAGDGQLQSEPATVSITVESVNDAPVAADDAYSISEDGTLVVHAAASLPATESVEVEYVELAIQLDVSATPFGPDAGSAWTGSTFWVNAYVQDLRDVPEGVVGGTIDILFDSMAVDATGSVVYGEDFSAFQQGVPDDAAGMIDETGALATIAGVGADGLAPFTAWQFNRADDENGYLPNAQVQFAAEPGEGTMTVAPANFALVGSDQPVDWALAELDSVDLQLSTVDFNGDQLVNHFDLALWLLHSGTTSGDPDYDPAYDLDADDQINEADLSFLMSKMYQPVAPAAIVPEAVDELFGDDSLWS